MAFAIGVTRGSFNVYQMRIYKKLGWKSGNAVRLALWAMAHREELQIAIPEKTAFAAAQKP